MSLRTANGALIIANDNWQGGQRAELVAVGLARSRDFEAAVVFTVPNANYTGIVSGLNGSVGVGLVEVYNLQ